MCFARRSPENKAPFPSLSPRDEDFRDRDLPELLLKGLTSDIRTTEVLEGADKRSRTARERGDATAWDIDRGN